MMAGIRRFGLLPLLAALALVAGACEKDDGSFVASGTFEAVDIRLGALTAGRLMTLTGREGDMVSRGQLIAEMDCEALELERELIQVQLESTDLELDLLARKVSADRISLENDSRTLERFQALHQANSATKQKVDDLGTAVELEKTKLSTSLTERRRPEIARRELEKRLELIDKRIEDSRIYAPVGAQVLDRYAEPGEVVALGSPLLRIADLGLLELRVYLPADYLPLVKLGQEMHLSVDGAAGRDFSGKVAWISPEAEFTPKNVQTPEAREELVYAVKLEVPNPDGVLKIGMPADVRIERE
jgi:HlyD family secretion protein